MRRLPFVMRARVTWVVAVGAVALSIAVADWLIAGVLADAVKQVAPDRLMEWFDVFVHSSTLAPAIWCARVVAAAVVGFWLPGVIDRARVLRVAIAAGLLVIALETGTSLMVGDAPEVLTTDVLTSLGRLACLWGAAAAGLRWPLRERVRQAVTWAGVAVFVVGLVANVILMPSLWRPMHLVAFQRVTLPVCFDGRLFSEGRALLIKQRNYEVTGSVTHQSVAECYRRTIAAGWEPVTPETVERGTILEGLTGHAWRDPVSQWRLTLFVSVDTVPESSPSSLPLTPGHRTVSVILEAPGFRWTPTGAAPPELVDVDALAP